MGKNKKLHENEKLTHKVGTKISKNNKTVQLKQETIQKEKFTDLLDNKLFDIKTIDKTTTNIDQKHMSQFLKANDVTISGDEKFSPMLTFSSTNFPEGIVQKLMELYEYPTPVQAAVWPVIMKKKNVLSIAKTGSGKTLGFVIPAIVHTTEIGTINDHQGPNVLVLTPTRELAQQIAKEFQRFGEGLKVSCVYGGVDHNYDLKFTQVLIATPGRLIDLLTNQIISLTNVSYLTLDEADMMLDMGFENQIKEVMSTIPKIRQTCLFSATWNSDVENIANSYCPNAVKINIGKHEISINENVTQHFIPYSHPKEHTNELISLIFEMKKKTEHSKILIFAATKKECKKIHQTLTKLKIQACEIHGDIDQQTREKFLDQFHKNIQNIVIATDVASRGIDVPDITTVINFDFPRDIETYVHRIGRTGRAKKSGEAYTFISENENPQLMQELKKILIQQNKSVPDFINKYTKKEKLDIHVKIPNKDRNEKRELEQKKKVKKQKNKKFNPKSF